MKVAATLRNMNNKYGQLSPELCLVSIQFQIMFPSQCGWVFIPNTELQIYIWLMLNLPVCNRSKFEVVQVKAMSNWNVACFVSLDLFSAKVMHGFIPHIVSKKLFK